MKNIMRSRKDGVTAPASPAATVKVRKIPENIVLIGFMGSGKTAAGRILAARLDWTFIDTDTMVEKEAGRAIKEIFARYGEGHFRELERQAVARAVSCRRAVIATGGGAVLDAGNVRLLREGNKVVWLKVQPETVLKRAGRAGDRPLLEGKTPEEVAALMRRREPYYAFADVCITTDKRDAGAVAGAIEEALRPWLASLK